MKTLFSAAFGCMEHLSCCSRVLLCYFPACAFLSRPCVVLWRCFDAGKKKGQRRKIGSHRRRQGGRATCLLFASQALVPYGCRFDKPRWLFLQPPLDVPFPVGRPSCAALSPGQMAKSEAHYPFCLCGLAFTSKPTNQKLVN